MAPRYIDTSYRWPYHGVRVIHLLMRPNYFSRLDAALAPSSHPTLPIKPGAALLRSLAMLCAILLLATVAKAQKLDELKPRGYVNDFANVLSQSARNQLTGLCTEVDQKAQAQIAVVTVKSLDGRPVEDYSISLATRWGIGPKQKDRGVMILLAVEDRKYWTEVGYGLESILPDGKVGSFGREAVPYLRQRDYDAAVLLMTRNVAGVIAQDRGVALTGLPRSYGSRSTARPGNSVGGILTLLALVFVAVIVLGPFFFAMFGPPRPTRRGGRWIGGPPIGGGWGGPFGGAGWGGGGGFGGGGGGGFGGFGGGSFGGGGAGGSW
jgi:uncharacterized protein